MFWVEVLGKYHQIGSKTHEYLANAYQIHAGEPGCEIFDDYRDAQKVTTHFSAEQYAAYTSAYRASHGRQSIPVIHFLGEKTLARSDWKSTTVIGCLRCSKRRVAHSQPPCDAKQTQYQKTIVSM